MRRIFRRNQQGFTMVEAIMVISITGIVAGMVAVFIRQPIEAYADTARRAAFTDAADTAARRIARDLQAALPNSVRVPAAGAAFLEFVPIRDAGRYRVEVGTSVGDDPLDFMTADSSFDVFGPPLLVLPGDSLVVYNLGIAGADVYETPLTSRRNGASVAGSKVSFTAIPATPLPFASPGSRFQIVSTPVSYVCDLASGTLWRYSDYGFQAAQPLTLAALDAFPGVTRAVLASNVTAPCGFIYTPGALQNNALVSILLTMSQSGESVTLQHQVNVDNAP